MFPNCRKIEYSKLINYDEWVYSVPWGWLWQHVFQLQCLNRPHTYFLRRCYMGVTWQATKWIRSHLGTNKIFGLVHNSVVGMWQTKTWRHPRGLISDSGVFDLHFESQRETRNLRNHGVPFDYIIDEETKAVEGKDLVFESLCVWGTQEKNVSVWSLLLSAKSIVLEGGYTWCSCIWSKSCLSFKQWPESSLNTKIHLIRTPNNLLACGPDWF